MRQALKRDCKATPSDWDLGRVLARRRGQVDRYILPGCIAHSERRGPRQSQKNRPLAHPSERRYNGAASPILSLISHPQHR